MVLRGERHLEPAELLAVDALQPCNEALARRRDVHHGEGPCTLHNASYDFNDDLIPLGATCWVQIAEQFLKPGAAAE